MGKAIYRGVCNRTLYVVITFHINLTEAKIATSAQSLSIQVVPYFLACTFSQILGATDFSCAVSGFGQSREMK